ncbi:hypothetical protein ABTF58_19520, partial [Acinetobacter baumannii]
VDKSSILHLSRVRNYSKARSSRISIHVLAAALRQAQGNIRDDFGVLTLEYKAARTSFAAEGRDRTAIRSL